MYKRYKAKHAKNNIKLNKLLVVAILMFIFSFESTNKILAYFTSMDSILNQFSMAPTYTIHFDSNNGTGTMPDQTAYIGHSENLNSNLFTRLGYGFNGWNTDPNGEGTSYADGASVQDLAAAGSTITLYAQWLSGAYSILYNLDGGTVQQNNPTSYTTSTATFTLNNPTKTGYTFTGWSGTDLTGDTNLTVTIPQGSTGDRSYTAHFVTNTYYVRYNANTGQGSMPNQTMTYGTSATLTPNSFEKPEYFFNGWATAADGSGNQYQDEESVINLTAVNGDIVDLYAQWEEETCVAEVVGGKKYLTLQAAINAVAANNQQKTIKLLKNIQLTTAATIPANKNIILNLQNLTISNANNLDINILINNGTLEIIGGQNGTIQSNGEHAAIDNNPGARLTVRSGNIIATGERQSIYNSGGTVEVTGTAYLRSAATDRPTIQNTKPKNGNAGTVTISGGTILSTTTITKGAIENEATGTVIITDGTVISQSNMGVNNTGTLIIGVEDEDADITSPVIQGVNYGVTTDSTGTLEFYDGIVKGQTHAFNNENYITDIEDNYEITHGSETIDGDTYETAYLIASDNRLVFNGNGGTPAETIVFVPNNTQIGALLPSAPTKSRHSFDGWFTDPDNGTQITSSTVITSSGIYYAHWTQTEAEIKFVAQGGTSSQDTLTVNIGSSIGSANLPTATKQYKTFVGWFTDPDNGTQIDGTETITKDEIYYAHWAGVPATVTFNPNLGTIPQADASRDLEVGDEIGPLPTTATRSGYGFTGWYPTPSGGTRIDETQVITGNDTYYAHWISNPVARIGPICCASLQAGINDVPTDNTETTVTLLRDTLEAVAVDEGRNIVLDMQNHTLYNDGTKKIVNDPVAIRNRGTLTISNGTMTANSKAAVINNETGGKLVITGGNIINTGDSSTAKRQAVYNNGGILEISGTAYLSAKNDGSYQSNDRGVIQNLNGGRITITGGTIESSTSHAIVNQSGCTLTIGSKDGTSNTSSPLIIGKRYGIQNKATFNFYDGIVKGITDSLYGTVTDTEQEATRVDGTETIGTDTYNTTCYQ